jgi:phage/plasmid primase-like uncharacterized protein
MALQAAAVAAEAVAGIAIFPNFSAEQRSRGLTDFNDLATQNPELVSQQLTSTKVFETRLIATPWKDFVAALSDK